MSRALNTSPGICKRLQSTPTLPKGRQPLHRHEHWRVPGCRHDTKTRALSPELDHASPPPTPTPSHPPTPPRTSSNLGITNTHWPYRIQDPAKLATQAPSVYRAQGWLSRLISSPRRSVFGRRFGTGSIVFDSRWRGPPQYSKRSVQIGV
ncbi:hypothetical protein D9611_005979 [Ephemerocybe angulata]|uniref:Uncharacterized protein n=1 Tax=Ephemerocybe angulata TaxID=980116 RepID=A0A8H5FKZ7_9AGAR|nr:hypothetical protein D9611_005979 [Tulosesus angulatus]